MLKMDEATIPASFLFCVEVARGKCSRRQGIALNRCSSAWDRPSGTSSYSNVADFNGTAMLQAVPLKRKLSVANSKIRPLKQTPRGLGLDCRFRSNGELSSNHFARTS